MTTRISYLKLSMYQQCPLKYKFHYIDGLSYRYEQDKPYLSMGESVHKALKKFFGIKDVKKRTLKRLHQLLRKNWIRKGYSNIDEEREYVERALEMLEKFYHSNDCTVKPLYLELSSISSVPLFLKKG